MRSAEGRHRGARSTAPLLTTAVALLLTVGGAGTLGWWNDTATVQGAALSAGTLDVEVDGVEGNPTAHTWTALTMADMAPGEARAAQLIVANAGSTPFTWSVTGRSTGTLTGALDLLARAGGTVTTDATYPRVDTCSGSGGTVGALTGAHAPVDVGGTLTLVPGAQTTLCVVVTLRADAAGSYQGATGAVELVVTATQS